MVRKHAQPTHRAPRPAAEKPERQHETDADAEAGMLSGISRKHSIRSNPCWFTEFCKSQCLSHFAAPFIVVRAETSIAESCNRINCNRQNATQVNKVSKLTTAAGSKQQDNATPICCPRNSTRESDALTPPRTSRSYFRFNHVDACE